MKRFLVTCMVTGLAVLGAESGVVTKASDTAFNVAYNSDWDPGGNGGWGFEAWAMSTQSSNDDDAFNGSFIGDSASNGSSPSGDINVSGEAFGLYANSSNAIEAHRGFDWRDNGIPDPLKLGDTFFFSMDNGFIGGAGDFVGITIRNGNATGGIGSRLTGRRFEFSFEGGDSFYEINDNAGATATTVGFTDDGLDLEFTLLTADTYQFVIKNTSGSTLQTLGGTLSGSGTLDSFTIFNLDAGSGAAPNAFFNEFSVQFATPEPSTIFLSGMGFLMILRRIRRAVGKI